MEPYSVLMSVYYKESPEFLRQSIQSMLDQTIPTNNFVIVCDGPLTPELDAVLAEFESTSGGIIELIRLPQNLGIGGAANAGLQHCKHDLVAKMDSDDISRKDRCELQLQYFKATPSLCIVGAQLSEFEGDVQNIVATRKVPLTQSEILQFAKRRMPFNNQTVMYRKSAVLNVGGYSSFRRCEDYELYSKIIFNGSMSANIDEVLVYFRLTPDAYSRRGMWSNFKGFVSVRWGIHKMGYSSFLDFMIPCLGQLVISLLPHSLKDKFYRKLLR